MQILPQVIRQVSPPNHSGNSKKRFLRSTQRRSTAMMMMVVVVVSVVVMVVAIVVMMIVLGLGDELYSAVTGKKRETGRRKEGFAKRVIIKEEGPMVEGFDSSRCTIQGRDSTKLESFHSWLFVCWANFSGHDRLKVHSL